MAIAKIKGEKELEYIRLIVKEKFKELNKGEDLETEKKETIHRAMLTKALNEAYNGRPEEKINEGQVYDFLKKESIKNPKDYFIEACYKYAHNMTQADFYAKNPEIIQSWSEQTVLSNSSDKQEEKKEWEKKEKAYIESKIALQKQLNTTLESLVNEKQQSLRIKKWLKQGIFTLIGLLITGSIAYFYIQSQQPIVWVMSSSWDGEASYRSELIKQIVNEVEKESDGKFKINVYNNAYLPNTRGKSVEKLSDLYTAVSTNEVQMAHLSTYYLFDKMPVSVFFCSVPGGMTHVELDTWLQEKGGQTIWENMYAGLNIKPFSCGHTGKQMGGWFKKPIKDINDFKGLRFRIGSPLGQQVLKSFGAKIDNNRVAEWQIVRKMAQDSLDGAEWIGPYDDYRLGMAGVRGFDYYYISQWHEPNTMNAMIVNEQAFNNLPNKFKKILENAIKIHGGNMVGKLQTKNEEYKKILENKHEIHIDSFPSSVENALKVRSIEVIEAFVRSNKNSPFMKDIYENYRANCESCKANWKDWEILMSNNK